MPSLIQAGLIVAASLSCFGAGRITAPRAAETPDTSLAALERRLEDIHALVLKQPKARIRYEACPTVDGAGGENARTVQGESDEGVEEASPKQEPVQRASAADLQHVEDAKELLASALERGTWTDGDEEDLNDLRQGATNVDWLPFMQQLGATLSSGRIRVTTTN